MLARQEFLVLIAPFGNDAMRSRGFTLIELAITMTVLAIVLLLAIPTVGTWLANTRIRNTAEALQNGLQEARNEAVRRNANVSFYLVSLADPSVMDDACTVSSTGGSWVVSQQSPAGKCSKPIIEVGSNPDNDDPLIYSKRALQDTGGNVTVNAFQSDGATTAASVTFNGFGRIVNTDPIALIDVKGPADSTSEYRNLRLSVSGAGAVRMCDPKVSESSDPRKC